MVFASVVGFEGVDEEMAEDRRDVQRVGPWPAAGVVDRARKVSFFFFF